MKSMESVFIAFDPREEDFNETFEAFADDVRDALGDDDVCITYPCSKQDIQAEYEKEDAENKELVKAYKKNIKDEEKRRKEAEEKGIEGAVTAEDEKEYQKWGGMVKWLEGAKKRRNPVMMYLGENIKRMNDCEYVFFGNGYEEDKDTGGKILYDMAVAFKKKILIQTEKAIDLS